MQHKEHFFTWTEKDGMKCKCGGHWDITGKTTPARCREIRRKGNQHLDEVVRERKVFTNL